MIKEPTFEAMPQNVARLEEKIDALTETVNKLSQHIFSLKASVKDEVMICVDEASYEYSTCCCFGSFSLKAISANLFSL